MIDAFVVFQVYIHEMHGLIKRLSVKFNNLYFTIVINNIMELTNLD
jgi:hypothetical protein